MLQKEQVKKHNKSMNMKKHKPIRKYKNNLKLEKKIKSIGNASFVRAKKFIKKT